MLLGALIGASRPANGLENARPIIMHMGGLKVAKERVMRFPGGVWLENLPSKIQRQVAYNQPLFVWLLNVKLIRPSSIAFSSFDNQICWMSFDIQVMRIFNEFESHTYSNVRNHSRCRTVIVELHLTTVHSQVIRLTSDCRVRKSIICNNCEYIWSSAAFGYHGLPFCLVQLPFACDSLSSSFYVSVSCIDCGSDNGKGSDDGEDTFSFPIKLLCCPVLLIGGMLILFIAMPRGKLFLTVVGIVLIGTGFYILQ